MIKYLTFLLKSETILHRDTCTLSNNFKGLSKRRNVLHVGLFLNPFKFIIMKNFKKSFFMVIMIAMTIGFFKTSAIAQLPKKADLPPQIEADGKYHFGSFSSAFSLGYYTNSSYTTRTGKARDIMDITYYFSKKGQKFLVTTGLIVSPMIDTLQVKLNLNELPGGGNTALCSNASGSGVFHTRSFRGIVNDANSYIINTADGTWTPAVCAGTSGYFYKQWSWEIDSITASQCNVNGNFYIKMAMSIECLRHPVGSAPYVAAYYNDGVFTWPHKYDFPASVFEMKNTKRVDAQYNTGAFTYGSDESTITTGVRYFPTNYYDSISCKKFLVELVKKQGDVLVSSKTINPYWDIVDDVNTSLSRTDQVAQWLTWEDLLDTTAYILKYYDTVSGMKILKHSYEIFTKKKYAEPHIDEISTSNVTYNSVTVTVKFTYGNQNATPYTIIFYGPSGVVVDTKTFPSEGIVGQTDTKAWTVNGLVPVTTYAIHPKKDGIFVKPQITVTTLEKPVVVTTFDPLSWTITAITFSADSSTATYTATCTPGNDGMKIYLLCTDALGHANEEVFDPAVTKTIPLSWYQKGKDYTIRVHSRIGTSTDNLKGTFTLKSSTNGGGTVGINSTDNIAFSVYPNPTTDIINIKGLEKSEKVLYDRLGQKVLVTTENAIDVKTLPAGLYFLQAGEHRQKIEKQ
jgi:hypothetical protein